MEAAELLAIRKQAGMTQLAMAYQLAISYYAYVKWENGQRKIPNWVGKMINLMQQKGEM